MFTTSSSFDLRDKVSLVWKDHHTNLRYAAQWFRFYTSDDESICPTTCWRIIHATKFALMPWGLSHLKSWPRVGLWTKHCYLYRTSDWQQLVAPPDGAMRSRLYEKRGKSADQFQRYRCHNHKMNWHKMLKTDPYNWFPLRCENHTMNTCLKALEPIRRFCWN